MIRNYTEIGILPAFHGDCILVKTYDQFCEEFNILVDGGAAQTFKYTLKAELKDIKRINLIVLTHIDSDHIVGLIKLFKSSLIDDIFIDEIWINYPEMVEVNTNELISVKHGDSLKELILLKKPDVKFREITTDEKSIFKDGIEFMILSPTPQIKAELYKKWQLFDLPRTEVDSINISKLKEVFPKSLEELEKIPYSPKKHINNDIFNSSSISFVLKCLDVSILLLADSRSEIITESLRQNYFSESNPIEVDFVKVSHHGSLNNTSQELLGIIKSNNFIISTNGGAADHKHPSRETIARIVYNSQRNHEVLTIYFNYKIDDIKKKAGDFINDKDFEKGNWAAVSKNWF